MIDLEDAVAVTKDANGKIKLHQAVNLTAAGAASGGFWGMLIGLIFLNPLLGIAVGASAGAVSGASVDLGINDQFMKDLAATLTPNSSALFVLVRKSTPDKVLEEVKGTGGTILKTSLSHEDETRLQAALSALRNPNLRFPNPRLRRIAPSRNYQPSPRTDLCQKLPSRLALLVAAVVLMLIAMIVYVMTIDEALVPVPASTAEPAAP